MSHALRHPAFFLPPQRRVATRPSKSTNPASTSRAGTRPVAATRRRAGAKKPFDIDEMMRRIRAAVAAFPDAAMFALRDLGYGSVFQQLVACIISIRTTDEVSLPTALALLSHAPSARDVAALSVAEIDAAIHASSFHEPKARQ